MIGDGKKVSVAVDKAKDDAVDRMNQFSIIRKKKLWILILLGVPFLYPFESTIVPSQNVLVVTEDWKPIQGAGVRQIWQDYSLEFTGHEQVLTTDLNGRVTFFRRTIRASLLRRMVQPILNLVGQGVHSSFGVHTDMSPLGDVTAKPIGDKRVEALPGDVVFRLREN